MSNVPSLKDYEIGKQLGAGSFGSVKIVRRKADKKDFAMKVVRVTNSEQKDIEYALNEIRILYSLNHENVIGYEASFFDEPTQTLNIVMELANDGDLESKIKNTAQKKLKFKESTIWSILIQILKGMNYIHNNNIIHRDLKSANIFLMKNGLVKIGDLNVSKIAKMGLAKTQTGTPYYSSPEIWHENSYNNKTDIWSIGCIIYEMCALTPPFHGTSLINLYNNIKKGVYKPIPKIYSKDLAYVISRMLTVDAEKRPSCQELLEMSVVNNKFQDPDVLTGTQKNNQIKAELLKTIKLPVKLTDINKELPNKKQQEEMMMNDEFEITKKGGFKINDDSNNKDFPNKNNLNNNINNNLNKNTNNNIKSNVNNQNKVPNNMIKKKSANKINITKNTNIHNNKNNIKVINLHQNNHNMKQSNQKNNIAVHKQKPLNVEIKKYEYHPKNNIKPNYAKNTNKKTENEKPKKEIKRGFSANPLKNHRVNINNNKLISNRPATGKQHIQNRNNNHNNQQNQKPINDINKNKKRNPSARPMSRVSIKNKKLDLPNQVKSKAGQKGMVGYKPKIMKKK